MNTRWEIRFVGNGIMALPASAPGTVFNDSEVFVFESFESFTAWMELKHEVGAIEND